MALSATIIGENEFRRGLALRALFVRALQAISSSDSSAQLRTFWGRLTLA